MKLPLVFVLLFAVSASADTIPLSHLDLNLVDVSYRNVMPPRIATRGDPIKIAGHAFAGGFSTHGFSRMQVSLDGRARSLHAWVGVTDDSPEAGPLWFEIIGDGHRIFISAPLRRGEPAQDVSVALGGIKSLILAVQAPGEFRPLSAWADAVIAFDGAAPVAVAQPSERPYILTPPAPAAPRINGSSVVGVRPGSPFLFTIPATGDRPMTFAAADLPAGLAIDAVTGQIAGRVAERGAYRVRLSARNARGSASRELRIVVGDTLALTPPMGWNSWNCFASTVTAQDVRSAADAMVRSGLINHGWTYVNIDDYWSTHPLPGDPIVRQLDAQSRANGQAEGYRPRINHDPSLIGPARDSQGRINANSRFPDMTALTDHIHRLGLKAGIYSSPGPLTCGGCVASYGHEAQDAARFAAWGFDYLKYDWCTYFSYAPNESRPVLEKPYRIMSSALRAQKRDVVFSLCQYGKGDVWEWGADVGGNCWRTGWDIVDSWGSLAGIGFSQNGHEAYAGPGHWNDPDMLVVGQVGWGRELHPTHLTPDEQYTHISLWSLLASPMLLGCDLTRLDAFTLSLLSNDEVIAVDQDPLGRQARRIGGDQDWEVWARPLADGSLAVGLFNLGELPMSVTARWTDLGLSGPAKVRDLWRQKDLGEFTGAFSAGVPRHGVVLVKIDSE